METEDPNKESVSKKGVCVGFHACPVVSLFISVAFGWGDTAWIVSAEGILTRIPGNTVEKRLNSLQRGGQLRAGLQAAGSSPRFYGRLTSLASWAWDSHLLVEVSAPEVQSHFKPVPTVIAPTTSHPPFLPAKRVDPLSMEESKPKTWGWCWTWCCLSSVPLRWSPGPAAATAASASEWMNENEWMNAPEQAEDQSLLGIVSSHQGCYKASPKCRSRYESPFIHPCQRPLWSFQMENTNTHPSAPAVAMATGPATEHDGRAWWSLRTWLGVPALLQSLAMW